MFTQILNSGLSDEETYIVHRGAHTFALLNAFPYTTGHLMVLPYREIAGLEDLDGDETAELWATVTDAVVARQGGVPAGRGQRRASTSGAPPAGASASTSTSTSCRAGPATATS